MRYELFFNFFFFFFFCSSEKSGNTRKIQTRATEIKRAPSVVTFSLKNTTENLLYKT